MNKVKAILLFIIPFLLEGRALAALIPGVDPSILTKIDQVIETAEEIAGHTFPPEAAGPARGLAAIKTFVDSVVDAMKKLVGSGLPYDQAVTQAQALNDSLSDPTKVYQAQHGEDAAYLKQGKEDAKKLLGEIIAGPIVEQPETAAGGGDASEEVANDAPPEASEPVKSPYDNQ